MCVPLLAEEKNGRKESSIWTKADSLTSSLPATQIPECQNRQSIMFSAMNRWCCVCSILSTLTTNSRSHSPVQQLRVFVVLVHTVQLLGATGNHSAETGSREVSECRKLSSNVLVSDSSVLRIYIALIHESIFSSEKPPPVLLVVRYA